jgi:hypothetical protein
VPETRDSSRDNGRTVARQQFQIQTVADQQISASLRTPLPSCRCRHLLADSCRGCTGGLGRGVYLGMERRPSTETRPFGPRAGLPARRPPPPPRRRPVSTMASEAIRISPRRGAERRPSAGRSVLRWAKTECRQPVPLRIACRTFGVHVYYTHLWCGL